MLNRITCTEKDIEILTKYLNKQIHEINEIRYSIYDSKGFLYVKFTDGNVFECQDRNEPYSCSLKINNTQNDCYDVNYPDGEFKNIINYYINKVKEENKVGKTLADKLEIDINVISNNESKLNNPDNLFINDCKEFITTHYTIFDIIKIGFVKLCIQFAQTEIVKNYWYSKFNSDKNDK